MSEDSGDSGGGASAEGMGTAVKTGMAVGGLGCLMSPVAMTVAISSVFVIGGFGVLFAPLIALILFFGGGGGGGDGGADAPDPDRIAGIIQGDGSGEFDPKSVPEGMADPITEAGALCPDIGPVVIAAQIDQESGFRSDKTGPDGEQECPSCRPTCSPASARTTTTTARPRRSTPPTRSWPRAASCVNWRTSCGRW